MWPAIIAFLVVAVFLVYLASLFLVPVAVAFVNVAILYILGLRIYTEIRKYGRGRIYAYCGAIAVVVVALFGTLPVLWRVTSAVILAFLLVHILILVEKEKAKKRRKES